MKFGYFADEDESFLEWVENDLKICDENFIYKPNYIDIFIKNSKIEKPENNIGFFNLLKENDKKKYPKEFIISGIEYLKEMLKLEESEFINATVFRQQIEYMSKFI